MLREPCEHGRYEEHLFHPAECSAELCSPSAECPGGRPLTDADRASVVSCERSDLRLPASSLDMEGRMSDISWDDLRVVTDEVTHIDGALIPGGPLHDVRPLTAAERDSLGRAWLREKIGDADELRQALNEQSRFGPWEPFDPIVTILEAAEAVLDALDGGPEDTP